MGEQESEAPQNVPQEEQLGPEEKKFLVVLKAVKGDHSDMKLDLPMYGGKMDNEEVLDSIDALDNYFDFKEVLEDQKVKLAKTKLKGSALTWWNYTQLERLRRGKPKINTWDRMVAKVKAQFLPSDYEVQIFRRLQNLKQKEMDVMTYTEEFHKLSLRAGHHEDEVEKIARYINGLRHSIQDELNLTTPRSVEECFQLATRAEEKVKRRQEQQARGRGKKNRERGNFGGGRTQFQKHQGETSGQQQQTNEQRGGFRGMRSNTRQIWKPRCWDL